MSFAPSLGMLNRVEISNYRGFQSYRLEGLARVNLIVGRNNSGKTALLEALHFATSDGDPTVLTEAALRRAEVIELDDPSRTLADVTHFFHGHQIGPGSEFAIRTDDGYPSLKVRLVDLPEDPELFSSMSEGFDGRAILGLHIEGGTGVGSRPTDLGLSERGGIIFNRRFRFTMGFPKPVPSAVYVPTDSIGGAKLAQLWRNALLESLDSEVVSAVRLVEPSIAGIIYVPSDVGPRSASPLRNFFVSLESQPKLIPLGSFGDGVRRLMILAVALARSSKGTLLIDEIDTGLHYSVMSDMWRLVIRRAEQARIQVFATTHSWDCIEGLSELCQQEPDLANAVAVHTIDRELPNSVVYPGKSVVRMVKHQIDPR